LPNFTHWTIGRLAGHTYVQHPHSKQSRIWVAAIASRSCRSQAMLISVGIRFMGHTSTHRPQLMQARHVTGISPRSTVRPDMPLMTGTSVEPWAMPIIGPPEIRRRASLRICAASSSAEIGVPRRTSQLPGLSTPSPVTVTTRSTSGLPVQQASRMASAVPTFWTTMPTSSGRPPAGTLRRVRA